jgi:alpha-1,2-mannosyltransferase
MNDRIQNGDNIQTENNNVNYGIERLIVSGIINSIFGLAVLVGLKAFGIDIFAAIPLSILSAITGVLLLTKRLPAELTGFRKRKPWLSTFWLLIALVALLQTARLSIFMIYPSQSQYSLFPGDKWMVEHCCLTAYNESARLAGEGENNIYRQELYFGELFKTNKEFHRKLDGFNVDAYHYPPPFLLLPIMARAVVGGNFLDLRMLWFAIGVLSLLIAIGFITYRLEPEARLRMIGTAPFFWCSLPVLAGLQMSNVQIIIIAISIISMAAFAFNKPVGGILLAMSSVAKIFPGILFIYIIIQRKFREAMWIAGFGVVLTLIAFIIVGPNPFQAFINFELPRLSSGEAFSVPFSRAFAVARNMAPFGIPLKLGLIGLPGMTLGIGRIVSSIHLLMVLILAIWAGRQKPRSNTEMISVWISLISLGSLVSPFAPANYVLVPVVLLVCLNREFFPLWSVVSIWLMISAPFLISRDAPFLVQVLCYLPAQFITIAIPAFILYNAGLKVRSTLKKTVEVPIVSEAFTDK